MIVVVKTGFLVLVLILAAVGILPIHIDSAQAQENTVNYTLTDLKYRDFSHKDLHGTSFAGAVMWGANFQGANMQQTIITKGDFFQANLSDVDFTDTFADRVTFDQTDLTNAIFTDAMLSSSTFGNAVVTGADFSGAIVDRYQVKLMCKNASGINPITGVATRDSLGCPPQL
ncbi:pentapeptide repeat-containing protein [Okeania sp. SIO3B5]|uniref:pentapeptide repeat-containing protein n=1 Tax=Okeania sp. SIO3B5 TaxID=2607811 RepID=UPI0025DD7B4D|nr:pentapeptide repeat-containing protein [Okeania sp. SIO3B5]